MKERTNWFQSQFVNGSQGFFDSLEQRHTDRMMQHNKLNMDHLIRSSSKKAVGKNIATEVHAGKPQKQAEAIALETQRRNR